jgi:carbon storage regulator
MEFKMLVLSRNIGERIMINDNIVITAIQIDRDRNQIKFGIEAPRAYEIHREEIYIKRKEIKESLNRTKDE